MRTRPLVAASAAAATLALALTGCVANAPAGTGSTLGVSSTDDACAVSANTASSGTLTFDVKNDGARVTEFYVLADDGLRIVGEVENIAPGTSRQLSFVAQPGTYFTTCKPGMVGAGVGQSIFTVTGEAVALSADDQALHEAAVANYKAYVRDQIDQLVPAVNDLVDAYVAGDDAKARELYAKARVPYERIEPTASSFGDLDPAIDYREVDALAEGLQWTGFHRIEKDLWVPQPGAKNSDSTDALAGWAPSTPEQRAEVGAKLKADIQKLADLVRSPDFELSIEDITNGAIGLLDEVATKKITGEEDWWSHTDLSDFQANVEGAQVAFGIVRDIAVAKGSAGQGYVDQIDGAFAELNAELAKYGSYQAGFAPYDKLTPEQVKALSTRVDALAEPLSQLTTTVLGLPAATA